MTGNKLVDEEWAAWQAIVELTKDKTVAFQKGDWERQSNLPAETEGQKVIKAIQEWGEKFAALRIDGWKKR